MTALARVVAKWLRYFGLARNAMAPLSALLERSDGADQDIAVTHHVRPGEPGKDPQGNPGTCVTWIHARWHRDADRPICRRAP